MPEGPPYPGFSSYSGSNSYLLYLHCHMRFVRWLIYTATEFREHVESVYSGVGNVTMITYSMLIRLACVVVNGGKPIPHDMVKHLNYMIWLRGDWEPRNQKRPKINTDTKGQAKDEDGDEDEDEDEDEASHIHFVAMFTLRIVKGLLARAPVEDKEFEVKTDKDIVLPPLPGEAFCWYITTALN
ncbi:hypothetical protein ONZ43_g6729 [Nemania bipapillata]|uniref:Uncharacterized protein n=1 Tax=Nemania bipapillata TaxID=110536 RepID=A0ACC2HWI0_9PEZI|nr:hypothetical protein ONZ43_g6729 [Nemania bipapillata]